MKDLRDIITAKDEKNFIGDATVTFQKAKIYFFI